MNPVSRRSVLQGLGLATVGVVATTHGQRTAMAANGWEDTTLSYESSNGTLPSLSITADTLSFAFSWSNFSSSGGTVSIELSARLGNTTNPYETVLTGSFTVNDSAGSTAIPTDTSLSIDGGLPVDVLSTPRISQSDFSVPDGDSEKTTPVDFRLSFTYNDETTTTTSTCAVTVTETSAVPSDTIDAFEAAYYGDVGRTLTDYYTGSVSYFARQTSTVYEGNHALAADLDSSDGYVAKQLYATNSNLNSPTPGQRFGGYVQSSAWGNNQGSDQSMFLFGVQSDTHENHYRAQTSGDGQMLLRRITDGGNSGSTIAETTHSLTAGEWYFYDVEWHTDGTIVFTITDTNGNVQHQISGSDTTYDSGHHGFLIASNHWDSRHYVKWDGWKIRGTL